jgi:hypothetical protein
MGCVHLGTDTCTTVACSTCPKVVELKVFTCAIHGECTIAREVLGVACCNGCLDYERRET